MLIALFGPTAHRSVSELSLCRFSVAVVSVLRGGALRTNDDGRIRGRGVREQGRPRPIRPPQPTGTSGRY